MYAAALAVVLWTLWPSLRGGQSGSTLHANAGADVVARFEALGALAGLAPAAVHAQLLSAVQVVVHVRRSSGRRVVDTVAVLARGAELRHLARQRRRRCGGPFRGPRRAGWSCSGRRARPAVERGPGRRACTPQLWPSCCGHCGRPCAGGRAAAPCTPTPAPMWWPVSRPSARWLVLLRPPCTP